MSVPRHLYHVLQVLKVYEARAPASESSASIASANKGKDVLGQRKSAISVKGSSSGMYITRFMHQTSVCCQLFASVHHKENCYGVLMTSGKRHMIT